MAFEGEDVAELRVKFLEVLDRVGKVSVAADELGIGHALGRSWAREAGFKAVRGRRHPRRGEYEQLRARGVPQGRAAEQVGVNLRTARDWDRGARKSKNARTCPGGLRAGYAAGAATMGGMTSPAPGLAALEEQLHPRLLTLAEREQVRDPHAAGQSLRAIGRTLGRPPARSGGRSGLTRAGTAASHMRRTGRRRHGAPGRRNTSSWPSARCGSSSRTGCAGGGHRSRYARLLRTVPWSGPTAATRARHAHSPLGARRLHHPNGPPASSPAATGARPETPTLARPYPTRTDGHRLGAAQRALNTEDGLKAAHAEIIVERARSSDLLGQVRDLESERTKEAIARITTENTTLKQPVRQLATDNRTLDERLHAARTNLRFHDKRIADLEAQLASPG